MNEKRRSQRLRTLKGGTIVFGSAPTVDCVVRNLSESGALLILDSTFGIPDEFLLIIRPEMRKRACQVAWRTADRIGVKFG